MLFIGLFITDDDLGVQTNCSIFRIALALTRVHNPCNFFVFDVFG